MKKILLIVLTMTLFACQTEQPKDQNIRSVNEVAHVDFANSENVLLDVRSAEEFAEGHLPHAINLDVNAKSFEAEIAKLDTTKTYYVYCQAGVRSVKACAKLQEKGFKRIVNLEDGYNNYQGK